MRFLDSISGMKQAASRSAGLSIPERFILSADDKATPQCATPLHTLLIKLLNHSTAIRKVLIENPITRV
jgi:hypothetical protein